MTNDIHLTKMSGLLIAKSQPLSVSSISGCDGKPIPVISGIAAALPLIGSSSNTGDPPVWNPARRIITFMGIVCLVCTLIVIGIVLVAIYLSRNITVKNFSTLDILYTIPGSHSRKFIELNSNNIRRMNMQIQELSQLIESYSALYSKVGLSGNCTWCHYNQSYLNPKCSETTEYGFYNHNPCVALVLKPPQKWKPIPFDKNNFSANIPDFVKDLYNPDFLLLTCHTDYSKVIINYSPFYGFPISYFSLPISSEYPPFVLMRFTNVPSNKNVKITCFLWSENIRNSDKYPVPGHMVFILKT